MIVLPLDVRNGPRRGNIYTGALRHLPKGSLGNAFTTAMKRIGSPLFSSALPPRPGDNPAFEQFFAHRPMLRAYIFAIARDSTFVDDVLSDVAVEVARSWHSYDPSLPFAPWVRVIARRVTQKKLARRRRWEVGFPDDLLESLGAARDEASPENGIEGQTHQLHSCIDSLPPRTQELVRLRYFEELDLDVIARKVGRTMGALYTAYSRIHAALLRCMERAAGAP